MPLGVLSREKGKHQNAFGCQALGCWVPLRPSEAGEVALEMLGHGGKHWGRAEMFPFSQPAYLPSFLSPPLMSVQMRQTGTKTPWGTISSCDKEEECSKHRLFWKAWDHCHPLPADTGALEEMVGSGALPTVLCRGTETFTYKRLLGAAEKIVESGKVCLQLLLRTGWHIQTRTCVLWAWQPRRDAITAGTARGGRKDGAADWEHV